MFCERDEKTHWLHLAVWLGKAAVDAAAALYI